MLEVRPATKMSASRKRQRSEDHSGSRKRSAYDVSDTHIFFKSNKANGYAFLSSFWPHVETQNAVWERFDMDQKQREQAQEGFVLNDTQYASREHYYQSEKWRRYPLIAEDIRTQATALDAKKRNTYWKNRGNLQRRPQEFATIADTEPEPGALTDDELIQIMYTGARAQFEQNPALRQLLLSTRGKRLSEVPGRSGGGLWAGGDRGRDQLGRVLERVRDELDSSAASVVRGSGEERRGQPLRRSLRLSSRRLKHYR